MSKTIVEENKELKKLFYTVEKAVLDFRMAQLENDTTETVNVPFVRTPDAVSLEQPLLTACTCSTETEVTEKLNELTDSISEVLQTVNNSSKKEEGIMETLHVVAELLETIVKKLEKAPELEEKSELTDVSFEELQSPAIEKVEQTRKPRKERGGEVFTDFKTLNLDNNNFEGNSIVYSNRNELQ